MKNFAVVSLFVALSACASSRSAECEVDSCSESIVSACKTSVEACETAGVLTDTCIEGVLAAVKACDATGDSDTDAAM